MQERLCHIESGRIVNRDEIGKLFTSLQDGTYMVRLQLRKRRSLPQNAYYWGVVCEMVKDGLRDAGFNAIRTADDAHEVTKSLFLKKEVVNEDTGELLAVIGRSTTTLSTLEFSEYIDQIIQWAAEYLCISIPYPNED